MDPVTIGSTIPAEKMYPIFDRMPFKKRVNINYKEYKDRFEYNFSLSKKKLNEDITFTNIMANLAQDMIMKFYIKDLVSQRVTKIIGKMDYANKVKIIDEVYKVVLEDELFVYEKEKIYKEIFEYLIENNILIIDGYLKFRSDSFLDLVDKAVEFVLSHIQIDMEYNEFISTLKHFVETQSSEIDLVNLVLEKGDFQLLDKTHQKIDNDHITELLQDIFLDEVNKSDILLSSLIGLSPKEIIIHEKEKEEGLVDTLKMIFTDRIKLCPGCSLCHLKISNEKD